MLRTDQLARTLFPLGELGSKVETRALARELSLPVADKPDSQEICFVSEAGGYREFLAARNPEMFGRGDLVDTSGQVVGEHDGVAGFTVGQRKGIGLTARHGRPLYVLRLEPRENRVIVGESEDLLTREARLQQVIWSPAFPQDDAIRVTAKVRYNMEPQRARLVPGEIPTIVFDEPVRAITPGQTAVAYRGRTVVAGGVIL